jgi:hypothetical protein
LVLHLHHDFCIADIFQQGGWVFNQLIEVLKNDVDVFAGMLVGKFNIATGKFPCKPYFGQQYFLQLSPLFCGLNKTALPVRWHR